VISEFKGQSFFKRLQFALAGLRAAFRHESSFRTQLMAATAVLVVLCIVRPPLIWWAVSLLAIGLVLVAELLNSALEALADLLHPAQHPEIRRAKDLAAGAVLLASVIALGIAAFFALR
jgi:undecaprenol kinase